MSKGFICNVTGAHPNSPKCKLFTTNADEAKVFAPKSAAGGEGWWKIEIHTMDGRIKRFDVCSDHRAVIASPDGCVFDYVPGEK